VFGFLAWCDCYLGSAYNISTAPSDPRLRPARFLPMLFRLIMYCLAGICAVGFLLSAACHVLLLLQVDPPGGRAVLWLIPGIFVIWPPLVLLGNWTRPPGFPKGSPDHIFAELPKWARAAVIAVFIYAMVNIVLMFVMERRYGKQEFPVRG